MKEQIDFKNNGLNTFRLLAALQVLCGHANAHLDLQRIPFVGDIIAFFSGVPIFFTLSGFLIWNSIGRSSSFGEYALKRFWRIYPELWVAVFFEIMVLLLLYRHSVNWTQLGLFTLCQATIFQFWTPNFLRDYGCGTPNGALWTITVLIQFYLCAYFLYKLLNGKRLIIWGGCFFVSSIIGWITPFVQDALPEILGKLYGESVFPYLWMFIVAAFVSDRRNYFLPFLLKYWWAFAFALFARRYMIHWDIAVGGYSYFDTILLFFTLVGFAYVFPKLNIKTDISYGVYIYHMTVVNALIALGYTGEKWELWLVIGTTCLLAWISTKTVGQLSMNNKKVIIK